MGSFNAQVVPESRVALSHYLIMDKYGHLVRVDNPLVSQGKKLFTSTIEFLDRTRTGVKLGPITSWWIMLQDRTHYFSASTASCSYLLSEPVVEYLPIMANSTSSCRQSALRTSN